VPEDPPESTFETLVSQEAPGLYRFLCWNLRHRQDAEDALQEVLIRAFRGFHKLRERELFKSWIYRIATNVAHDSGRKRSRGMPTIGLEIFDETLPLLLGAGEPAPILHAEKLELDRKLSAALASLSPELREPLLLHTLSGMKYREVAEALGWPMGTVTTRIHVARQKLAEALRPHEDSP
jgi:RNA polymerase sigma-70 factor (ECF subfamily)